jgi:hypothetical protein
MTDASAGLPVALPAPRPLENAVRRVRARVQPLRRALPEPPAEADEVDLLARTP